MTELWETWAFVGSILVLALGLPIISYLTLIYRELGRMSTGRVHEHLEIFEAENQPKEWRADVSYFGAFLAGVCGAGDDAGGRVSGAQPVGSRVAVSGFSQPGSGDCHAFPSGHAALPDGRALAETFAAAGAAGDGVGVADSRVSGGCGIAGANFGAGCGAYAGPAGGRGN